MKTVEHKRLEEYMRKLGNVGKLSEYHSDVV
jgi:hypothetical protein